MNISLTPDQRAFIQDGIAAGRFQTEEDAIQHALALWEEYERRRLEILAAVDRSEASLADGRGRTITTPGEAQDFIDGVKQRVAARYNAEQKTGR